MDFYRITEVTTDGKNGKTYAYPDFVVCRSKDLMVRGQKFYAIWDDAKGYWSTDEYDVQRLVDADIRAYVEQAEEDGRHVIPKYMSSFTSNSWMQFRRYVSHISDSYHPLDETLTFSNTEVQKEDYVSRRLPYPLQSGSVEAYDELISTLYDPQERDKLEWAIGAIVSGDSRYIQKFLVLYGSAGTGKSTVLNIVQKLFAGYYTTFDAKSLTGAGNAFATEVFKGNPLVAIQHDGDLSRIEDNTKLNSIVSHEDMTINEKNKPQYTSRMNAFLFMGTNKPVRITDAKSGIIRRLIDVRPTGSKIPFTKYQSLMSKIQFELGAIAQYCLDRYLEMGKDYYSTYRPVEMMLRTDVFLNYIEYVYEVFKEQNGVSLVQAYNLYKQYCDEALVEYKLPRHRFRDELKNYFQEFQESTTVNGKLVRNYYSGFITEAFTVKSYEPVMPYSLVMDKTESILDEVLKDCPAQYANEEGTPLRRWSNVTTTLKDLDTQKLHYVKVPENHIVIDFDLKDDDGQKSVEKNLEAASKWPATYSEFSQGGAGIHLHYLYTGAEDVQRLSRVYSDGIEIKVFSGDSSLRRRLSYCNNTPVAEISSGLPLKEKKVINQDTIKSEKGLRSLVERNLRKEIHPGTKPSMDFIKKILDDAYSSGMTYDLTDMRPKIMAFAMNSTHQSDYCLKLLNEMKFKSAETEEDIPQAPASDNRLVFFDCEVFPNLFLVNWKYEGKENQCVRMINPSPTDIEDLCKYKLVGFNNRKYDNHILYARILGYNNYQLYQLSKRIISNSPNSTFVEAYKLSYTDVYDFSSKKQSLKKWEIELGLHHQELGLPWDEPVPEEMWPQVAEYCDNDVISTEAVFDARKGDWTARQILADIAGMTVNDTTNNLTTKIIFGNNKKPKLVYTDLRTGEQS